MQGEAAWSGYSRQNVIRADPSYPCRSVCSSGFRGKARPRGTRTPTVTLSTSAYRLSPIGYEQPSALQGEARLHGLWRITSLKSI